QDHSNGLGIFVLEIGREHVGLHVGKLLPHVAAGRPTDFLHDGIDLVLAEEAQQQALGGVGIARQRPVGRNGGDELDHQVVEHFLGDRAQAHHGAAELLDLEFVQLVEDWLAVVGPQRQQQGRGLLVAGEDALVGIADNQLLATGYGGGQVWLFGRLGNKGHETYAALPSQSRTISAAWRGFSSTRVPTVLRVWSWVSPIDLALATQAGVLSTGPSSSGSGMTWPSALSTP